MSIPLTSHGIHTPEEICKCKTEAQKGMRYIDKNCHCSPQPDFTSRDTDVEQAQEDRGENSLYSFISFCLDDLIPCIFMGKKKEKCVRSVGNSVKNKKFDGCRIDFWMLLLPHLPHSI